MQPQSQQMLSDSAFFALRFVLMMLIFVILFLVIRGAIITFVGQRAKRMGWRKYIAAAINAALLALLFALSSYITDLLQRSGMTIGRLIPVIPPEWTGRLLVGFFYTFLSLLTLLLLIQSVGAVFWFFEARLSARSAQIEKKTGTGRFTSVYVLKTLSLINRGTRTLVLVLLVATFLFEVFTFFRASRPVVEAFMANLGYPARTVAQAILDYLPNLAYLAVIGLIGKGLLRILAFTFRSIGDGTLKIPGFLPEWASQTYTLLRLVVLAFLLMVSYPYLPGAGSQFFQGFSLFFGALFTFGSSGAIGNIISGITLTYTSAFRIGDFVRIGENTGFVHAKTLLVTRIVTKQNEVVTIPNGNILATSVLNYTQLAESNGLTLTVDAGIGYDVDWRTVNRLMIEGARRTGHILSDPAPCVWQQNLGDYAVSYQLRACTDRADLLFETHSDLRANVLDEFNRAGVEIMTPSIFAHRDASGLAIPQEQLPDRPAPRGIAVELKRSGAATPETAAESRG